MISEAILIPKIYARWHKIVSNFLKIFWGGLPPALAPLALGSGLHPLTGPPFPKFLDPPLKTVDITPLYEATEALRYDTRCHGITQF